MEKFLENVIENDNLLEPNLINHTIVNLGDEDLATIKQNYVVVATLNVTSDSLVDFVRRIQSTVTDSSSLGIILATHRYLDSEVNSIISSAGQFNGDVSALIVEDQQYTFAASYLTGLQYASLKQVNGGITRGCVVEIDSGGGHLPEEINQFIEGLEQANVVLGSRFIPGAINTYPIQRRLVSKGGTLISNLLLGTNLTDCTSGYESFNSHLLKTLFEIIPPKHWLSATRGPFHMYQTEMRAYISWLEENISEVAIIYGAEKEGKNLSVLYLINALHTSFLVALRRFGEEGKNLSKAKVNSV